MNSISTPRVVLQGKGGGIIAIACGTAHTAAITQSGELYTWGKHDHGRLGYEVSSIQTSPRRVVEGFSSNDKVINVVCGIYDTCVITNKSQDNYF